MGTAGLGNVFELWLLGPDVVVELVEKLAHTRAARDGKKMFNFSVLRPVWTINHITVGKIENKQAREMSSIVTLNYFNQLKSLED